MVREADLRLTNLRGVCLADNIDKMEGQRGGCFRDNFSLAYGEILHCFSAYLANKERGIVLIPPSVLHSFQTIITNNREKSEVLITSHRDLYEHAQL